MYKVIFSLLFTIFSFNLYAGEYFNNSSYEYISLLDYNHARDYHFSSSKNNKNIISYKEYENKISKEQDFPQYLEYNNLSFTKNNVTYYIFILTASSYDNLMRIQSNGESYITIWDNRNNKFNLIASNIIYAIYGASYYIENNNIIIESPMGLCETVFLKTTLSINDNLVYYNNIDLSFITAENKLKHNILYDIKRDKPILLNNKNGTSFNY